MSGFCGACGTPPPEGARFCLNCGAALAPAHSCPTCGQSWPNNLPWIGNGGTSPPQGSGADVQSSPPPEPKWEAGMYLADDQRIYFDGRVWTETTTVGGISLPDPARILDGFDPAIANAILIVPDDEATNDRARGPLPGPDYIPSRDCGNCGWSRSEQSSACETCGSTNTGPTFNPASMNEASPYA